MQLRIVDRKRNRRGKVVAGVADPGHMEFASRFYRAFDYGSRCLTVPSWIPNEIDLRFVDTIDAEEDLTLCIMRDRGAHSTARRRQRHFHFAFVPPSGFCTSWQS